MDRPVSKRAQLHIVNLQWTPKDENAVLKINGKCDKVMKIVMSHLGLDIPSYNRSKDPIFHHAIRLQSNELSSTSQPHLEAPTVSNTEIEEDVVKKEEIKDEEIEEIEDDDVVILEDIPKNGPDHHISMNSPERYVIF